MNGQQCSIVKTSRFPSLESEKNQKKLPRYGHCRIRELHLVAKRHPFRGSVTFDLLSAM